METAPQIVPISDMRIRQADVLKKLHNGPVYLAQRSKPAAVLVSVNIWNEAVEQLNRVEELEDLVEALEDMLRVERGEMEVEDADIDELEKWADRVSA